MGNSDVTTHKFTAILSKKVDAGKIMNALAHMSLGIVANNLDKIQDMNFGDYIDKDSGIHPSLSNNSYVILRADNGNQIRSVRNLAKKKKESPSSTSPVQCKKEHIWNSSNVQKILRRQSLNITG